MVSPHSSMRQMLLDNARENLLSAAVEYAQIEELADKAATDRFKHHVNDSMQENLARAHAKLERAARLYARELINAE